MDNMSNAFIALSRSETRVKELWVELSDDEKEQVKSHFDYSLERLGFELK